jgi:hypothetical protein
MLVTATATDADGNLFEFSENIETRFWPLGWRYYKPALQIMAGEAES